MTTPSIPFDLSAMTREHLEEFRALLLALLAVEMPGSPEYRYLCNLLRRVEDALNRKRARLRMPPAP